MKNAWRKALNVVRQTTRKGGAGARSAAQVLAHAEVARDQGRWAEAAALYQAHAGLRPRRVGSHVQLGNMWKQAGNAAAAESAYRAALEVRPTIEAWAQLGHLLLAGGREVEAVQAFESALALVGDHRSARAGLIAAGARGRLPQVVVDAGALARLQRLVDEIDGAVEALADAAITPIAFYDAFRRKDVLAPPPGVAEERVAALIDARGASPARVRATLHSLLDQSHGNWTALILADSMLMEHPVASLASIDPRIRFETDTAATAGPALFGLTIEAGVVLRTNSLAWFIFSMQRSGGQLVYADHDYLVETSRHGARHIDPVFHPAPDPDDMASTPSPPPVALWRDAAWAKVQDAVRQGYGGSTSRAALVNVIVAGGAAHLPLTLSSVLRLSPVARVGLPTPAEGAPGYLEPIAQPPLLAEATCTDSTPIRVIIPTRDEASMLEACVDGLLSLAKRPDRLHITIVDNRSSDQATADFLARGAEMHRFSVMKVDEPFNWSRINNLAAAASDEPLLLLLNNDTEMLTEGWDERLARQLARPDVGVLGARLLYPDRTVQHGGVVLGLGGGGPRHEGVGATEGDGGPLDRWRRSRTVAAVTGAFLGVRRDTYVTIGGFDERLAIGYNDIDFCLACRRIGLRVLYGADIELLHHESRTRGLNDTRGRISWDLGELMLMRRKWGAAMLRDPAVNPRWATISARPFDGIRPVSPGEAVAWLDAGGGASPWAI